MNEGKQSAVPLPANRRFGRASRPPTPQVIERFTTPPIRELTADHLVERSDCFAKLAMTGRVRGNGKSLMTARPPRSVIRFQTSPKCICENKLSSLNGHEPLLNSLNPLPFSFPFPEFGGMLGCGPVRTDAAMTAGICATKRSDRGGVERGRAADFAGQAWRQQAHGRYPPGDERGDVHPQHRMSVARDSEGLAAQEHGPRVPDRWTHDGTLERLHHALYVKCREQAAREASPTAAIIDAQSVKSAEKGGASIDPHGYDAGKKVKGKSGMSWSTPRVSCCTPS